MLWIPSATYFSFPATLISFQTVQYNIGCYPFNKMRLLAEATPVIKKTVYRTKDERKNKNDWYREGDFLILPRAHVWHKQRKDFKCENEKNNNDTCKVLKMFQTIFRFPLSFDSSCLPFLDYNCVSDPVRLFVWGPSLRCFMEGPICTSVRANS